VLSREEHTVVDNYGRGQTTQGSPSAPGTYILSSELSFSSGDHKKGILVLPQVEGES
jgi:hypothetical protein